MRHLSLFILAALAMTATARTQETTVWEGSEAISWNTEVAPGTQFETPEGIFTGLAVGNIIKIYSTTTYDSPQYVVTYKAGDSWSWTDLSTTVDEGVISYTVESATIATEIADRGLILRGQAWTATRITITTEVPDDVTYETVSIATDANVSTGNWENNLDLSYDNKGDLAETQMNDIIRVAYTTNDEGSHVCIANPNGWSALSEADVTDAGAYDYVISSAKHLETVQQNGILVRGKNITITTVELLKASNRYDAVPLTIGEEGIVTFGSSKNLDFADIEGATPYYASAIANGTVTLTPVATTRGWAGYIVRGTAGDYDVPVAASEPKWLDAFNTLRYGGDYNNNWVYRSCYTDYAYDDDNTERIKNNYRYILAKDSEGTVAFHILATDYTQNDNPYHLLAAHKAYLETTTDITPTTEAKGVSLVFDATTGISETLTAATTSTRPAAIYTLSGQRVAQPRRGIYIVGGRKVVVK